MNEEVIRLALLTVYLLIPGKMLIVLVSLCLAGKIEISLRDELLSGFDNVTPVALVVAGVAIDWMTAALGSFVQLPFVQFYPPVVAYFLLKTPPKYLREQCRFRPMAYLRLPDRLSFVLLLVIVTYLSMWMCGFGAASIDDGQIGFEGTASRA